MAPKAASIALALLMIAGLACISAQSAAQATLRDKAFVGVWRGEMDGLPAVVLNITNESGSLSGAALFYFHQRKTVNDPYSSTPGIPEPMLKLSMSGQALRFEISHKRAHPPHSLQDPPVHFRLTLVSSNRAELVMERGENESEGKPLAMVRSDY